MHIDTGSSGACTSRRVGRFGALGEALELAAAAWVRRAEARRSAAAGRERRRPTVVPRTVA
jgi:hypothetical protein